MHRPWMRTRVMHTVPRGHWRATGRVDSASDDSVHASEVLGSLLYLRTKSLLTNVEKCKQD